MRVIEILKDIGINLSIDSYFKINNELQGAEFDYYQLKNTPFEFNYRGKKVLHFTNIESARLILENNYLRGSNFNKFNDPFEIIQPLSLINIDSGPISDWVAIKANTFAVSFTEKTKDNIADNYEYHWQEYGNRHQGIALEFEFLDACLPYPYFPLKINYLSKDNSIIRKLSKKIPNNFHLSKVDQEFLLPILASIKDKKYDKESEVRLMYKISEPEIEHLNNSIGSDVFFSFKENNSLNLELRVPFSTPNNTTDNFLRLNKIYLGKKFHNPEDQISWSVLKPYFDSLCKKEGIKLISSL